MDDKKKIVLGSEDILVKGVNDIFLNVSLQQTFNEIKKSKYDNNFDLAEQFRKERNASRDFRIYGIVDSTIIHTDNLTIKIYKDSGLTQFVGNIKTTPLVYNEENVYGKRRGKYLLELNNYDEDLVYFKIQGNNLTYGDQVFEQRLVFYTLDGEFVEYGTETVDIGLFNPGFLTIENDFPFFYNKHWIKKNLDIAEEKPTVMQFGSEFTSLAEGESIAIDIVMDKPSPFGNESVVLNAILGTVVPADFNLSVGGSPVSFPITLNWSAGEQNKSLIFDAIDDEVNEFSENLKFELSNFQFTNSGLTINHYVTIEDATPRKKTIYHLGEIYKNRVQFTGRTANSYFSAPATTASAYSILRNGLHFGNTNEEFYPGDTYSLIVTNMGIDTILPVNTDFGINTEQLWPAGTSKQFNLDTNYTGTQKHKVKMYFPSGPFNFGKLRINGADMGVSSLNFSTISTRILDSSSSDWLPSFGLEKDWTAVAEGTSAITITSKTTGLPVKIDIIPTSASFGFPVPGPPNPAANPYLVQLSPYVEKEQIPKALTLYANNSANNQTIYEFQFVKQGYNGVFVSAQTQAASATGVNRYLVTSFNYICRNWNDAEDKCIYTTAATQEVGGIVTSNPDGSPVAGTGNYLHPVGTAHINGSVLLAANNLPFSKLNLTTIKTAAFKPYPLIVEPCTDDDLMAESISQLGILTIPPIGQTNNTIRALYASNASGYRSFDFRTGTTGPYTTFYKDNALFFTSNDIKWGSTINTSGAIVGSGVLSNYLDYGNFPTIPDGPVLGLDSLGSHLSSSDPATTFYLESKIPGVPFQITNIVNAYVINSATVGIFGPSIIAGQTIGPITYETIIESAIAGVDINRGKNWMGGYNTDLQIGPGALGGGGGTVVGLPSVTLPPAGLSL